MTAMHRIDPGHFAGSEEAFRHWDEDGVVPANCVKCHQAEGLPQFLREGVNISQAPSNSFLCTTCHTDFEEYGRYEIASVTFPSGATVTMDDPDSNLCISCHQGRTSTVTVDTAVQGLEEDTVPERALRFANIHYFAAGATLFGDEVQGAYQFRTWPIWASTTTCLASPTAPTATAPTSWPCRPTSATPAMPALSRCRLSAARCRTADYDGDGDTTEGLRRRDPDLWPRSCTRRCRTTPPP
jgi:hypothetical protein